MAEASPETAKAGIFKENNHGVTKDQQSRQQKPAALTGKLEVSILLFFIKQLVP